MRTNQIHFLQRAMSMRLKMAFLMAAFGFLFGGVVQATDPAAVELPQRPNLVVVLCDDLGYGDLGCFGHPHIRTPNLDRLAGRGIRLEACYSAAPVCSPSRVGLLTGRSPNRAGVYDWIPPARQPRPDSRDQVHMRREEVTLPQLLRKAGYATCLAGKWHCNSRFNSPQQPQPGDAGFDHWLATQNNAAPSHRNPTNFVRNGQAVGAMEGYSCQLVVSEALGWLEQTEESRRDADQPFFLMLTFHEPHEPVASPPELVAGYDGVATSADQAEYYANVENVDKAVGRLWEGLESMKLLDNTLIVFTSDNGPETLSRYRGANRSHGSPGPLRGMKLWTTEAGFRVPGILCWPGVVEPGQTSTTPVSSLDLLPTFCRLAGADLPERRWDGVDISPLLEGRPLEREKPLLWCYYNAINVRRVAMRSGKWKVLARLQSDSKPLGKLQNVNPNNAEAIQSATLTDFQMFDLEADLGEQTDLWASHPQEAQRLKATMQAEFQRLVADSPVWPASESPSPKR